MKNTLALAWALPLTALMMGAALADPAPLVDFDRTAPPDTVSDYPGFTSRIFHEGRLFISGQPEEEAVHALPEHGVTCVVNLRTPHEMDDRERVSFDEKALVEELGIDYVSIPLGGADHPYTPEAVETFADALERHQGPVLLHCASGWRASYLWAAYLVKYQGFSVEDAYARGEAIGIGESPLGKLLGRRLKVVEAD